jgi:hypothetical protein
MGYSGTILFPGLSPVVKRQGHEADHPPPFLAQVKNAWSYTVTPTIRLNGVVLNQTMDVSLWGGTKLSTGAILPLPFTLFEDQLLTKHLYFGYSTFRSLH